MQATGNIKATTTKKAKKPSRKELPFDPISRFDTEYPAVQKDVQSKDEPLAEISRKLDTLITMMETSHRDLDAGCPKMDAFDKYFWIKETVCYAEDEDVSSVAVVLIANNLLVEGSIPVNLEDEPWQFLQEDHEIDIRNVIDRMARNGLIGWYTVEGKLWVEIRFTK